MSHRSSRRLFVAEFEREDDLLSAVRAVRRRGLVLHDVYSPYAVHGLDEAMELRPSRLSWVWLACGAVGAAAAWWLQHWTSTADWPLNVGGKPFNSLPAFVPVMFELAVLLAGLGGVAALLVRCRLYPGRKAVMPDPRVTDDRFALVLVEADAAFDLRSVRRLCDRHGAARCGEWIDGWLHWTPRQDGTPRSPAGERPPEHAAHPRRRPASAGVPRLAPSLGCGHRDAAKAGEEAE